jgi:uncharacterized membrane protein YhaH (DUF805 family)
VITIFLLQISRLRYWLACATVIVILSVYGRILQKSIAEVVDTSWVAVIVFVLLFLILLLLYKKRKTHSIPKSLLILSCCLIVAGGGAVHYKYLVPVETLHFLVFFCYGCISVAVFGPLYGEVALKAMAVGDEILQYYLPSRVGDLHDVLINSLSGLVGLALRSKW